MAKTGFKIFGHLVIKYLPELVGNVDNGEIVWEEVTVGALAAQLPGTGGFWKFSFLNFIEFARVLITSSHRPFQTRCAMHTACSHVFKTVLNSDVGFGVLGRVLERLTNQTYDEALKSVLGAPLGLSSTSTIMPPSEGPNTLALPRNEIQSGIGHSGGVYPNARDLRALGLSILQSKLLSGAQARQWMKPHVHTSSLTGSVGAPWEIYQLALPVS
ncbi:beta-lactamase/transpeptidase-like protein [Pyrenochaeta sp. MPI-SDFR-AT-0127]|nr:beta-lactamase/transpeptidase-like protein [Pyrenochaeta sp. MPI-SDFR-AT-0127]